MINLNESVKSAGNAKKKKKYIYIYSWNFSTCICENGQYLKSIADTSVI